jgi:hypothetical protein
MNARTAGRGSRVVDGPVANRISRKGFVTRRARECMDSNSLPMAPDLDVFPRVLRYLFLAGVVLFVAFALLLVVAGVTSA